MPISIVVKQVVDQLDNDEDAGLEGIYAVDFSGDERGLDAGRLARLALNEFHDSYAIAMLEDFDIYVMDEMGREVEQYPFETIITPDNQLPACSIDRTDDAAPAEHPAECLKVTITADDVLAAVRNNPVELYIVPPEFMSVDVCAEAMLAFAPDNFLPYRAIPANLLDSVLQRIFEQTEAKNEKRAAVFKELISERNHATALQWLQQAPELTEWVRTTYLPAATKHRPQVEAMIRTIDLGNHVAASNGNEKPRPRL